VRACVRACECVYGAMYEKQLTHKNHKSPTEHQTTNQVKDSTVMVMFFCYLMRSGWKLKLKTTRILTINDIYILGPCYNAVIGVHNWGEEWTIIRSPSIHLVLYQPWRLHTTVYFVNIPSNCLIICWLKHKYYLCVCVENKTILQNCAKSNSHVGLVIFTINESCDWAIGLADWAKVVCN